MNPAVGRVITADACLNIGVQFLETAMSRSEPRGVIRFASDDLNVARRLRRGSPGQCGIEFTERRDLGREPVLAAKCGRQGMIVPKGEVVVAGRNALGTINHTLLTVKHLQTMGIKEIKVVLMGVARPDLEGKLPAE